MANISGTHRHIANRKSILSTTTPSTLGEKNLVNFGPQTKVIGAHIEQPKLAFFWRLHFGHYGVLRPAFFNALEIDQGYLAYPLTGTGIPPPKKKNNREILKFGLKISV